MVFVFVLLSLCYFIPRLCYTKQKQNQWGNLKLQPELLDSVETKFFWKDFYESSVSPYVLGNLQLADWMIKMQTFIFGVKDKEISKWASSFLVNQVQFS